MGVFVSAVWVGLWYKKKVFARFCKVFLIFFCMYTVVDAEGLYCKRPIQCLASSKILTPHPLTAWRVCARGGHSLGGEGVGGQYFEHARHWSVLYICKYFVEVEHLLLLWPLGEQRADKGILATSTSCIVHSLSSHCTFVLSICLLLIL